MKTDLAAREERRTVEEHLERRERERLEGGPELIVLRLERRAKRERRERVERERELELRPELEVLRADLNADFFHATSIRIVKNFAASPELEDLVAAQVVRLDQEVEPAIHRTVELGAEVNDRAVPIEHDHALGDEREAHLNQEAGSLRGCVTQRLLSLAGIELTGADR